MYFSLACITVKRMQWYLIKINAYHASKMPTRYDVKFPEGKMQ